mmetsp:Transcript_9764/g.21745  ORF Transcript_9764/g.21745 Transcript_9764/m.21745 type:complete len:86 (+) Transcript_9764:130-387(+)
MPHSLAMVTVDAYHPWCIWYCHKYLQQCSVVNFSPVKREVMKVLYPYEISQYFKPVGVLAEAWHRFLGKSLSCLSFCCCIKKNLE